MKERPILFSAPMVRAILAGTKTQTRRAVKQQITPLADGSSWHQFDHRGSNYRMNLRSGTVSQWSPLLQFCPYGQPGDRLWVRETHMINLHPSELGLTKDSIPGTWDSAVATAGRVIYAADPDAGIEADGRQWHPSIHMPRWASRITLEITGVRVERLQDISADDARSEGCPDKPIEGAEQASIDLLAKLWYHDLWESINGAGSWEANPWVWVIEFRRVDGSAT